MMVSSRSSLYLLTLSFAVLLSVVSSAAGAGDKVNGRGGQRGQQRGIQNNNNNNRQLNMMGMMGMGGMVNMGFMDNNGGKMSNNNQAQAAAKVQEDDEVEESKYPKGPFKRDPDDPCVVMNSETSEDITTEIYNPKLRLVNCEGKRACVNLIVSQCSHIICNGPYSCEGSKFNDIIARDDTPLKVPPPVEGAKVETFWNTTTGKETGQIQCLGTNSCIHAVFNVATTVWSVEAPPSDGGDGGDRNLRQRELLFGSGGQTKNTVSKTVVEDIVNVECVGNRACWSTIFNNVHHFRCEGKSSCNGSKVLAHGHVQCDHGGPNIAGRACNNGFTAVQVKHKTPQTANGGSGCFMCGELFGCTEFSKQACRFGMLEVGTDIEDWSQIDDMGIEFNACIEDSVQKPAVANTDSTPECPADWLDELKTEEKEELLIEAAGGNNADEEDGW